MAIVTEDALERWVLEMLAKLGWVTVHGPDIAPGESARERSDYREVILERRLEAAVADLNPELPADAVVDVVATVRRAESPVVESENWRAYRFLVEGVPVEYRDEDGSLRSARARLIDWDDPAANDLAAVNQFTIEGPKQTRRPDVLLFVNGLPMALFELKRPGKALREGRRGVQPGSDLPEPDPRRLQVEPGHGRLRRRRGEGGFVLRPVEPLGRLEDHRRDRARTQER